MIKPKAHSVTASASIGSLGSQLRGFTLIEVVVSLGLVMILVSLLLPGVQSARETARRAQCLARLRGLATATEGFVAANRNLPGVQRVYSSPGGATRGDPSQNLDESIHSRLLPYLEFNDLYEKLDKREQGASLREPLSSSGNQEFLGTHVAGFVCPSDSTPTGSSNYRGCAGSTTGAHATWTTGMKMIGSSDQQGFFGVFQSSKYEPRNVRDGLSQTVLFSERVVGDGDAFSYSPFRDLAAVRQTQHFFWPDEALNGCSTLPFADRHYSLVGHTWLMSSYGHTIYNHVLPPNSKIPDCMQSESDHAFQGAMTARSMHPGGVNVVFADGAGRFVSEAIDLKVWRALGSINGGEIIGEF